MIELVIIGIALVVIYGAAVRMVRANRTYTRSMREIRLIAQQPVELAREKTALEKRIADNIQLVGRLKSRMEQLKVDKATLAEELDTIQRRPKDKLYAMERVMQPGLVLWEVLVSNDVGFRDSPQEEFRLSWAHGRRFLVAAPTERDARRRSELKFLGSQGYRILSVQKSTRFTG